MVSAQVIFEFDGTDEELDEWLAEIKEDENTYLQDCQTFR